MGASGPMMNFPSQGSSELDLDANDHLEMIQEEWAAAVQALYTVCGLVAQAKEEIADHEFVHLQAKLGFSKAAYAAMLAVDRDPIREVSLPVHAYQPLMELLLARHGLLDLIGRPLID